MKNIKKTVLGMFIGLLAFGFSAYTTKKAGTVLRYYKTDAKTFPSANDPQGYQYFSDDRCEVGGPVCSATWDLGLNPLPANEGDILPLTGVTFISGAPGHFE